MIKAVIFDMDGVIIDSEPIWNKAEIDVFERVGVHLTEDTCREPTGLRVDEVVEYWFHRYPWEGITKQQVEGMIFEAVIDLIKARGEAKKGLLDALEFCKKKELKIALASSSPMIIINAVLEKLQVKNYFDVIYSAEFEDFGKPHPGVYITTAKKLGIPPFSCIAIEDSITGIISAKAAKMKCIAVPDIIHHSDKRLGIADVIISSLADVNEKLMVV